MLRVFVEVLPVSKGIIFVDFGFPLEPTAFRTIAASIAMFNVERFAADPTG